MSGWNLKGRGPQGMGLQRKGVNQEGVLLRYGYESGRGVIDAKRCVAYRQNAKIEICRPLRSGEMVIWKIKRILRKIWRAWRLY